MKGLGAARAGQSFHPGPCQLPGQGLGRGRAGAAGGPRRPAAGAFGVAGPHPHRVSGVGGQSGQQGAGGRAADRQRGPDVVAVAKEDLVGLAVVHVVAAERRPAAVVRGRPAHLQALMAHVVRRAHPHPGGRLRRLGLVGHPHPHRSLRLQRPVADLDGHLVGPPGLVVGRRVEGEGCASCRSPPAGKRSPPYPSSTR